MLFFGCPAHDQRDYDFAKKYQIEIIKVVKPKENHELNKDNKAFDGDGIIINSEFLNGLNISDAKDKIISVIVKKNIGKKKISYRLKIGEFLDKDIGVVRYQ